MKAKLINKALAWLMTLTMVVSMLPASVFAAGGNVAKVGDTEYATIDEAVANWTNGTTLTLLADVTLSDVIKLSSTEYHILDLGTYTMTAAKNKDAIQYAVNGRSSAGYALDIKADAENPGGITATGKAIVSHTKPLISAPGKDRPITRFYGGVFNASYVVKQGGTFGAGYTGASAPYFYFYGGEFNGTIYTNRSMNQFHGGTFNGSLQMSVDSSAYTLIAGGTFKNLSNLMGSALNSDKFTIGDSKGVYNKDVYVDDNGCYVIGTAAPEVEAGVAMAPGTNDYFAYSKVATEGSMNYTDVAVALEKNNSASAEITVYVDELDLTGINFKGTIVAPEGKTLTITNAPDGLKTEGNVVVVRPAVKIGTQGYDTLAAAVAAAEDGDVITVVSDIADEAVSVDKNVTITGSVVANNVSIDAITGCTELTVSGLSFTGNSWINAGKADKLTVSGVTADVTPSNAAATNSRGAFISLGRSEGKELDLTVTDCNIVSKGGTDPILGWAKVDEVTISGSTFGSASAPQTNSDSIKFMSIADGAVLNFTGNTVYSNYNGIVLAQNTTRGNAYTANFSGNTFVGGADHIWIEISGGDTCHATVNVASDNTVNGNAFAAADIKAHTGVIKNWSSYAGVDVVTDVNGKVIGGTLAFAAADAIAEGYEMEESGKVVASAPAAPAAVKIGDAEFATLAEALAAAAQMTGDVTVEIFDKVTMNANLTGSFDSITFVGKEADAEIYMDIQGAIYASGKKVAFQDLKLSKVAGGYVADAGFRNLAFGLYAADEVTYNNCVFANGAYASGKETFTNCTFCPSHDRYGLWVYGADTVLADGCTFAAVRGIKMYNEAKTAMTDLTVKNTDFSSVTGKPAIVLTYGESVTLEGNTYSATGVFELDLDGKPDGTAVTSDVAPTCINDNGTCGVLVDGKIYTTAAQANEVAVSGSNVTLLHDSAETVEFAEGVNLNKNGFTAAGVTVKQSAPAYVAEVDGVGYTDIQEAIKAAAPAGTVELLSDVTVDEWKMVTEKTIATGQLTTLVIDGMTIDGNGKTLTIKDIESASNGGYLFDAARNLTVQDLTINVADGLVGGIGLKSGTISNVTFIGGKYGVLPGEGDVTIEDCTFKATNGYAIYFETDRDDLVVKNNTFEVAAGGYAITLRGEADFTNNTVKSGRVNLADSASGEVSGNDFGTERFKVYNAATATITGNTINNLVFNDGTATQATFNSNTMSAEAEAALAAVQPKVAQIGEQTYATLEEAAAAAQAGDEIKLLADVTENVTVPAGITLNGNGFAIGGVLTAGGNLTIAGHTKAASFAVKYSNTEITIGEGACLEVTGTGRVTIGYGCKFNITGTIADAKTADKAAIQPSLIIPGGTSITGGTGVTFNATNAYIKLGNSSSKNSAANGTFDMNFTNCIVEFTNQFTLSAPTGTMNPVFNVTFKDSVVTTVAKMCLAAPGSNVVVDNSTVKLGTNFRNSGVLTVKNGSTFEGGMIQFGENGGNDGTITVDNASFTIKNNNTAYAMDGNNTGKLVLKNGAAASVDYIIETAITLGSGSKLTCKSTELAVEPEAGYAVVYENGVYSVVEAGLSGSGTEADPFVIASVEDLILFRDSVNAGETKYSAPGVYVALAADIDLAGINWVGIGSIAQPHGFMGNFDGKGFKVKNLTITNPTLDSDGYAYAGLFSITEGTDKDNQNVIKNLTIENVTISTTGHIVSAAIAYPYYTIVENVTVCGDINIIGGNYTAGALAYTRRCVNASNVTVSGSVGSAITGAQVVGGVISDIQMNGGLTAAYSNFSSEGLTITGTKNVGGISGIIATQTLDGATVKNVAIGGADNSKGIVSGVLGGTSTIKSVTYENVTGATAIIGGTYDAGAAVEAKIGNTYYATLDDALAAAQTGETIELLAPIVVAAGESLTLDKAVTITYTSNVPGEDMITNRGTLVIDGATLVYTNTDTTGSNVTVSTISSAPGSVLTVNSGVVKNDSANNSKGGAGSFAYAIDLLTNGGLGDVTATINGGEVISTNYMAIRQFVNGETCKNTLTVNGGTIQGATRGINIQLQNNMAYTTINGGTIEGGDYALCFLTTSENLSVTGGEFKGEVWYSGTDGFITGGTFDSEVTDYCAEGYTCKQNADGTYGIVEAATELFTLAGITTSLDSSLALNIYYTPLSGATATDYYAVVAHQKEDTVEETTIPYADWGTSGSKKLIRYAGLAAKEMADELTVTIYDADGTAVSKSFTTSFRAYAIGMMSSGQYNPTEDRVWFTALTDMLNYGAAAQQMFGYKTGDLANAGADDFQQYASTEYTLSTDGFSMSGTAWAPSLTLESTILLNFYFNDVTEGMYATYAYTTHAGTPVSATVDYGSFVSGWGHYGVAVPIAIADAGTPVTVTMFHADGSVAGTMTCSANNYLKGMAENNPDVALYPALAKFATSAKEAFAN